MDRLGYAITPRFAPTSSPEQLHGAGEIAQQFPDVWIQSHVAENLDEIRWVHELFPEARSYLDVYDRANLLRQRSVYAHCIYLDDTDRRRMAEVGATAAVSPTSNLFLGSGFFDYEGADRVGFGYGLASDVGGGTSFSPWLGPKPIHEHTNTSASLDGQQEDIFVASLNPDGRHSWHTFLGSTNAEFGGAIGVGPDGALYALTRSIVLQS